MKIRITKEFTFEMAHALMNYAGACRNIHGHSYSLSVTVLGEPDVNRKSKKLGMVMDFADLKKIVTKNIIERYDHAMLIHKNYYHNMFGSEKRDDCKIVVTDFQPTSENLIIHFVEILKKELPDFVKLERLLLRETASSYVEWLRSDQ